jgi:hypothetical protein
MIISNGAVSQKILKNISQVRRIKLATLYKKSGKVTMHVLMGGDTTSCRLHRNLGRQQGSNGRLKTGIVGAIYSVIKPLLRKFTFCTF